MIASNPYNAVAEFERAVASYADSRYAIAVESCSAALFLSCKYLNVGEVTIPRRTYPSVPAAIIHAGGRVVFADLEWAGVYPLLPYMIVDGALRFHKNMYEGGLHCLSFHSKKRLPIGRGGMILTDNLEAYEWLKKARFDGRDEIPLYEQKDIKIAGWNMYMTPEQAVRGLELLKTIEDYPPDIDVNTQGYPDLSQFSAFK